ncbi:MAG: hypothetical protein U5R48_14885 [Gammaproteobacteria bacterium]|nr:hypothetical protein [Gammaproteobacteria bacterium]
MPSDAATVDLNSTAGGLVSFAGLLDVTTLTTGADSGGANLAFDLVLNGGATVRGAQVSLLNTGSLTLGDAGETTSFANGVVATEPGTVNMNGTVVAGVITLGDAADTTVSVDGTSVIGGASAGRSRSR